ncbi:MAG: cyclic nucleotide-binding domain-containing protein [Planctomycetota bacterium]|nr:MAG: cyclic nucleotide-binding domain-containing protein [Planctomycetota bacterium]
MQVLDKVLSEHPFFKGFKDSTLELLGECARPVQFAAGKTIFREGEPADSFYLLTHGLVTLDIHLPGKGPVTIQTLQEGEVLGWAWLFPPAKWHFDACALQLTRAIRFDGRCLMGKLEQNPELGFELMKRFSQVIVERLQAARLQLLDLYGSGTRT